MKQKNTTIWKAFLCGGAAMLFLAGCTKESSSINEKYRPAGTPITFSAATGYENGTGTRTEYSGQLYDGTQRYERIDWVENDPVTIVYAQGTGTPTTSQYIVTEVSGDTDRNSYASVEVAEGQTKLTWGDGEGDHTFYAMYPSNDFGGNTSASLEGNHVTGSIPPVQTPHVSDDGKKYLPPMQYGYMVAYKQIAANSTESRVTLPFTPAVTAFEFKLQRKADDPDLKVTGVELTATTPLTGTFAFDITGGNNNGATWNTAIGTNATTVTDEGHTVSFTFPETGGVSVPGVNDNDNYLDFTLFGLPVQQTGLVLKLIYADDSFKTLALNDAGDTPAPHVFAAAKKHIITNTTVPGGDEWIYHIDELNDVTLAYTGGDGNFEEAFKSYRYKASNPDVKEKVAFTFEYSEDGGQTWSTTAPSWLVASPAGGNHEGSMTGDDLSVTVSPQVSSSVDGHHSALVANGSYTAAKDLSTINVSNGATVLRTTANCYVIDRPGNYKFPLVYGNGVVNGEVNEGAFRGRNGATARDVFFGDDETNYFGHFKDHLGQNIMSPYIAVQHSGKAMSAVLVWQDALGLVTVDSTISGSEENAYITFSVPTETITQGNALIALLVDDNDDGTPETIAWSWHIWVTEEDMTQVKEGPKSYMWAPVNVGWCDAMTESFESRSCQVRAVQESSGMTKTATLTQTEGVLSNGGNSPYYQRGRKDPLQASDGNGNNKTYYPTSTDYAPQNGVDGPVSIAESIRRPFIHFTDVNVTPSSVYATYNWLILSDYRKNMWNSVLGNSSSRSGLFHPVFKTVYDPSPVGFKLPTTDAVDNFTTSNTTWCNINGTEGRLYLNNNLFFPALGGRARFTGALIEVSGGESLEILGIYWLVGWNLTVIREYWGFSSGYLSCATTFNESNAYPVRPVVDPVQDIPSTSTTGSQLVTEHYFDSDMWQ